MNDRIIALVAFLTLFAWLWSTEHKNREERIARRAVAASQLALDDVAPSTVRIVSVAEQSRDVSCFSVDLFHIASFPSPDGIWPECCCVGNCRDALRNLDFVSEQISAAENRTATPQRDFNLLFLESQHWIFENLRAFELAATTSTPAGKHTAAGDVESYPTGACFESMRASAPTQSAEPQVMQWGPWLDDVRNSATQYWAEQRQGLMARVEQRRARADDSRSRARRLVNSLTSEIEAFGIRWMDRLVPAPEQDEITLPEPVGRLL
ncbi:hypothetical protein CA54_26480 [Symmachiella macrocystis]|uniref:Uncharacterized protein n=1 Tax=Symmachiella macrocystis TaxID=2527985 RepID=A0A5C6BNR1_9PLAN|nr:hypothetical protein [Symmachiella macrocystis]TWU13813.1 hypothetical protein CA54_26480 [Symmachiella macrocystis]